MSDFIDTDVLIIGGGPAGCACALYTARSALSTIILDKNPAVGALAITHKIANYPGVEKLPLYLPRKRSDAASRARPAVSEELRRARPCLCVVASKAPAARTRTHARSPVGWEALPWPGDLG